MIYLYIYLIFNSFLYASFVNNFVKYKRNYIQCEKYTKNYVIKRKKQNVVCYAALTIYEFYIFSYYPHDHHFYYYYYYYSYGYLHILFDFLL